MDAAVGDVQCILGNLAILLHERQRAALRQKTISYVYDKWHRLCVYVPYYTRDECKKNMGQDKAWHSFYHK